MENRQAVEALEVKGMENLAVQTLAAEVSGGVGRNQNGDKLENVSTPVASTALNGPPAHSVDALLPKQTVVKIIGNNRTKSELVGRQGVVKGAQTLGGWHEVLLERNALEVVSLPAVCTVPQIVAPMGASGMERNSSNKSEEKPKSKTSHQSPRNAIKSKKTGSQSLTNVHIERLDLSSLRRYRRVFNLNVSTDCTREELVFAVRKHFSRTKVDENEVIVNFVRRLSRKTGHYPLSSGSRHLPNTTKSAKLV